MMEILGLIFDGLVIIGLAVTILYAISLHRDVQKVLTQKSALENLMAQISQKIQMAEHNFKSIQLSAQEIGGELENDVLRAKELLNELSFMLEAGDSMVAKLADAPRRAMPSQDNLKSRSNPGVLSRVQQQLLSRMEERLKQ